MMLKQGALCASHTLAAWENLATGVYTSWVFGCCTDDVNVLCVTDSAAENLATGDCSSRMFGCCIDDVNVVWPRVTALPGCSGVVLTMLTLHV